MASKAARCRLAAGGAELIDFSFRRTQTLAAAMAVARASAIVGFAATSNVAAARRYGLRPSGTMAHSFVEAFADERTAFTAFATDFPDSPVFLVDTYDTEAGVRTAVDVIDELGLTGPAGIRLDSGDLGALAAGVAAHPRRRRAAAGAHRRQRRPGRVRSRRPGRRTAPRSTPTASGTKMGVSADAPSLDSAYKLVAFGERPVMKLSEGKATLPGAKQVYRGDRCRWRPARPARRAAHRGPRTAAGTGHARWPPAHHDRPGRRGVRRAPALRRRPGLAARRSPPPRRPGACHRAPQRPVDRAAGPAGRTTHADACRMTAYPVK